MRYSIGLQSGATDGAVAWGILDRLLEDERIEIEAISGASSGSINTIVCGYGFALGGRHQARELLERFWRIVSQRFGVPFTQWLPAELVFGRGSLASLPQFWAGSALALATSPYFWNPANFHIIRETLPEIVDFEKLRKQCPLRLFISATDVMKGKARIFRNDELDLDVAAASTCLPLYLPAQHRDDSFFWDGGLIGAPKLQPLVEECEAEDIIFIRISPVERPRLPYTAFSVIERTIELSIAAGVDEELKRIDLISQLIEEGRLKPTREVRRVRIHGLEGTDLTRDLPFSSKYNLNWHFLCELRDFGRELASRWLAQAPHASSPRSAARAAPRKSAAAE